MSAFATTSPDSIALDDTNMFTPKNIALVVERKVFGEGIVGSLSQRVNDPFYIPHAEMTSIGLNSLMKSMEPFLTRDGMSNKVTNPSTFDDLMNSVIPSFGCRDYSKIMLDLEPIFASIQREDHPGFVGYTQGYPNYISVMGELLKTAFNPIIPVEWTAPGFNTIQRLLVKWLCQIVGYNSTSMGGHCVSGGSEANELCLAAAVARFETGLEEGGNRLEFRQKAVIYASKRSHDCIVASAHVLGFDSKRQVVMIPTLGSKDHFKINPEALEAQIIADRAAGKVPIFLSACAGSTMLAAYDDFEELYSICHKYSIWLHGDGSWGGASLFISAGRECLKGVELSDSFVIDPHKGLYEPYGLGIALMQDQEWLKKFFAPTSFKHPDIAVFSKNQPHHAEHGQVNNREPHHMKDYGRQLTQPCKAFGFYMSLQYYGLETYSNAVQLGWNQADRIAKLVEANQNNWRIIVESRFAMLTIQKFVPYLSQEENNNLNANIVLAVCAEGFIFPNTNYFIDDSGINQVGIRLVVMNPMADNYPERIMESLEHAAQQLIEQNKN